MMNMEEIVKELKEYNKNLKILIGGAPVNEQFKEKIGADFYSPDPQGAVEYLNRFEN
jgi:5-methyltetrahydrofolate--homocysteine methyltransferase